MERKIFWLLFLEPGMAMYFVLPDGGAWQLRLLWELEADRLRKERMV